VSSRSALLRALLFLLAVVPAVWGICPRWAAGETCGAPSASTARCACCPPADDQRDPCSPPFDSGSCPVIHLRYTVAPAPDDVVVPVPDLSPVALAPVVTSPWAAALHVGAMRQHRIDASGGAPPPLVGTVVLVV